MGGQQVESISLKGETQLVGHASPCGIHIHTGHAMLVSSLYTLKRQVLEG